MFRLPIALVLQRTMQYSDRWWQRDGAYRATERRQHRDVEERIPLETEDTVSWSHGALDVETLHLLPVLG